MGALEFLCYQNSTAPPQWHGGWWLKTFSVPSQPPSLDTSRTVDPFLLDVITYYVRMGTQPIYFQIYTVRVSIPTPQIPRVVCQRAGPQDPTPKHPGPGEIQVTKVQITDLPDLVVNSTFPLFERIR